MGEVRKEALPNGVLIDDPLNATVAYNYLAIRHAIGGVKQWSLRTSLLCTAAPVALRGKVVARDLKGRWGEWDFGLPRPTVEAVRIALGRWMVGRLREKAA